MIQGRKQIEYPASEKRAVLMFVRTPEKGKVKSRLSGVLGEEITLELYKNFVMDLIETLNRGKFHFSIYFYPPDSKEKMVSWLGSKYSFMPQEGNDLGERMKNAFTLSFLQEFRHVIAIGSDSPDLPDKIIEKAFLSLVNNDSVIGPCFDGGYYLIGFRSETFIPDPFKGIEWGTDNVFENTLKILKENYQKTHILPKWRDIDRHEDLIRFAAMNKDRPSNTMRCLLSHKEILE